MVFSDPFFLFAFLPLALFCIGLSGRKFNTLVILIFSLVFYYWSSGIAVLLLVASIAANWCAGLLIEKTRYKAILVSGIMLNLVALAIFKYAYFFTSSLGENLGVDFSDPFRSIVLPVGISFFTFQGVSYLIDVWRRDIEAEHNLVTFGAYLSFFPQLIAGPIVRYRDVIEDYRSPRYTLDGVSSGATRFAHGLIKKVLVADSAGYIADAAFGLNVAQVTMTDAWVGAFAYSVQIYFDFSAYSDMAIGLGQVCGIRFNENFRHPYSSSSITEFWRRWHISLSTWFRDYLYVPLGGNRHGALKTYRNLFIVFAATGLWHGASWTFVVWGLYHGAFLILEKILIGRKVNNVRSLWTRYFYVLPVVLFGWVLFRAPDISFAVEYLGAMFQLSDTGVSRTILEALTPLRMIALLLGLGAYFLPRDPSFGVWWALQDQTVMKLNMRSAYVTVVFLVGCILAISSDFSPFLYFRF